MRWGRSEFRCPLEKRPRASGRHTCDGPGSIRSRDRSREHGITRKRIISAFKPNRQLIRPTRCSQSPPTNDLPRAGRPAATKAESRRGRSVERPKLKRCKGTPHRGRGATLTAFRNSVAAMQREGDLTFHRPAHNRRLRTFELALDHGPRRFTLELARCC